MGELTETIEEMLGGDEFTGIDNEALDFNQLEDLINGGYDWLDTTSDPVRTPSNASDPICRAWVNITPTPESQYKVTEPTNLQIFPSKNHLPDSPPDSGSEPPYSPPENVLILPCNLHVSPLHNDVQHSAPSTSVILRGSPNDLISKPEPKTPSSDLVPVVGKKRKACPKSRDFQSPHKSLCVKEEPSGNNDLMTTKIILNSDDSFSYGSLGDLTSFPDGSRSIKFSPFQPTNWHIMCDSDLREIASPFYQIDADKGFNFSPADEAFVCQKKNHFQVTVHVRISGAPHYVKTAEGLLPIDTFKVHFYGVKAESPSQAIRIEQSQSDRSKRPFHPVLIDGAPNQLSKLTVGRLHFSETTSNNMRKKGKPNPDQRYFNLVIGLHAHSGVKNYPIVSQASDKIIVRASNPGQFENDVDVIWQKNSSDAIFHMGKVGINVETPDESLSVHGNIKVTGNILQPSDQRVKQKIEELDTKEQLKNVQALRVVRYKYLEQLAEHFGVSHLEQPSTGMLAQEVQEVLPDAVNNTGDLFLPDGEMIPDFLVVNKDRIFLENVGAVKELSKVTTNLENRIIELEKMNQKLSRLRRMDSFKSTCSVSTIGTNRSSMRAKNSTMKSSKQVPRDIFCSNRLFQIVIIILALIMAFCAISMATLYILEWQKRNPLLSAGRLHSLLSNASVNNYPSLPSNKLVPSAINLSSNDTHHKNGVSEFLSFIPSKVTPMKLQTPVYESILPGFKSKPVYQQTVKVFPVHAVPTSTMVPHIVISALQEEQEDEDVQIMPLGVPSSCVLDSHDILSLTNCPIYCCLSPLSALVSYESQGLSINFSPLDTAGDRHFGTNRIVGPISSDSNVLDEARVYKHLELPQKDSSTRNSRLKTMVRKKPSFGRERREDGVSRAEKIGISIGKSHQTLDAYPPHVEDILLADWNVSVLQLVPDEGSEVTGHTFRIPLSKRMPLQNLHVVFKLNDVSETITYCPKTAPGPIDCLQAYSEHPGSQRCVQVAQPDSSKTEYREFSVNAGHWLESSYTFRIPRFSSEMPVCQLDEGKRGVDFLEYTLVFYRHC